MSVSSLLVLAAEAPEHPNLWNPTVIGIATVVCAVILFCGSVYLLLGTNMGGRLGFLVSATGLTAFMLLLATLWWTSGSSGIDPPHGKSPAWHVIGVVDTPSDSTIPAVKNIATDGRKLSGEELTNIKPAIDATLVAGTDEHGEPKEPSEFASEFNFSSSTDYIVDAEFLNAYQTGGGAKNVFWHHPNYAVVELCHAVEDAVPPVCDPLEPTSFIILEKDLGTLRQPVVAYWFMSALLFGLSLLGLHWYEKDQRERKRAALVPVKD